MLSFTPLLANRATQMLFESPGIPIAVLAIAWAVMRITARRTGNKKLGHFSWLPLILIFGLLISSSMVKTDREQLDTALRELLVAVETNDMPLMHKRVASDAMTRIFDNEYDRDSVERMIDRVEVKDLLLLDALVEVTGPDEGRTLIRVRAKGEASGFAGINFYEWAIRWRLEEGEWRAQRLECTSMGVDAALERDN